MNARAWVLTSSLLLGCLPAPEPYRCDLAGGDRACDSVPGARCVSGYCAESVSISLCSSGLRYTSTALRPGGCVAVDDAPLDATDAVVDVSAPPDLVPAIDLPAATDVPPSIDLAAADLPTSADVIDAGDAPDVRDAAAVLDAPDVRDAAAVLDAPDVRDAAAVLDALDVRDAAAVFDAGDAPDVRDAAAVFDAPDVRDVSAVFDVPVVPDVPVARDVPVAPLPPVDWLSPLPNERFLSGRITVRIARRGNEQVRVRTALGINCDGVQTVSQLTGTSVDVSTGRNYLCLRLEVGADGGVWTSPWRRIVSMGRTHPNSNAAVHWGRWPDFNNDGRADLLMATATAVRVFHFASSGAIGSGAAIPGPSNDARPVAVAAVGDVDGDSFGDAVITWDMNPGREVFVHRGGPGGLQGPGVRLAGLNSGGNTDLTLGQRIFPIGDREGDGRTNFGVSAAQGVHVRTFGIDAQGSLREGATYVAPARIEAFVSDADVDGDGLPDSAFTTSGATFLSLSGQTNNILIPSEGQDDGGFGRRLAFGSDLDNDGRSELVVLVPGASQAVVYQVVNAQLRVLTRVGLPATERVELVMPGDVNADAWDDLYAFAGANGVRLRRGNISNDIDAPLVWAPPLGVILAGAADDDTRGRVWGPGSTLVPNGFVVYNFNGGTTVPIGVAAMFDGPVIAVAP